MSETKQLTLQIPVICMYYTLPPSLSRGFLISQGEAESIIVAYTTNTVLSEEGYPIHNSGANSHVVQISMLHPLQIMFIPIGWQKLFQAAITAANNAVATI